MRPTLRLLLALTLVLGLTAACSGDDGDTVTAGDDGTAADDGDTAVTSPPDTGGATVPPGVTWTRIEPTADLVNPVVATPDSIVPDPDDPSAVLVRFYGGVQECYGARATVVEQSDSVVRIRLETGGRPDVAPDTACIEIAEAQELQVVLDAPVAERELIAVVPD